MGNSQELVRMIVPGCRAIVAHSGKTSPAVILAARDAWFSVQIALTSPDEQAPVPGERVAVLAQDDRGLGFFDSRIIAVSGDTAPRLDLEWPAKFEWRPRREYARAQERIPVTIQYPPEGGGPSKARFRGHTIDISVGGVQAFLAGAPDHSLERGHEVHVVIEIPDGWPPLEAEARVVRVMGGAAGGVSGLAAALQFTRESDQALDRIARCVQISLRHTSSADHPAERRLLMAPRSISRRRR